MNYSKLLTPNTLWVIFGFAGQAMFFGRFLVQWLQSERVGRSVIPVSFWYLSIIGGLAILIYSLHVRDPVFIAGQSIGVFVYSRNLYFIYRERRSQLAVTK